MAISNHERVGKALDLLKLGLQPFVERELKIQTMENISQAGPGFCPTALILLPSRRNIWYIHLL